MSVEPVNILVPGRGMVNSDAMAVDEAVRDYDNKLRFGFNEVNQDWIIYIKMPRNFDAAYYIEDEPVYPVIGFGPYIPAPHEAIAKLEAANVLKHGTAILNKMNRENIAMKKAEEDVISDRHGDIAERLEFAMRKEGLSPVVKVFFSAR